MANTLESAEQVAVGQYVKAFIEPFDKHADPKELQRRMLRPFDQMSRAQESALTLVRVSVVDTEDADRVKVRFPGKPAKFDMWLRTERIRLITNFVVNWEALDDKLPIDHEPRSRQIRKDVFQQWDTNRKKSLSIKELQRGVREYIGNDIGCDVDEVEAVVKCAWKLARHVSPKGSAKTVNFAEFHPFLVSFRWYLEIEEIFESLDARQEDDQRLSLREVLKGREKLANWGIDEAAMRQRFAGRDIWTPVMKFEDFARWCIEKRWSTVELHLELDSDDDEVVVQKAGFEVREAEGVSRRDKQLGSAEEANRRKVKSIFEKYDADGSGTISEDELLEVFSSLEPPMAPEAVRRLFHLADSNQDGYVDYEEFCLWLFR